MYDFKLEREVLIKKPDALEYEPLQELIKTNWNKFFYIYLHIIDISMIFVSIKMKIMNLVLPSETVFHDIESAIKAYRKYAQQQISSHIDDITIDQSLALIYIDKHPELNQIALAELLFKDTASLTRMIKTMVKNGFIEREINSKDLRRYKLILTRKGKDVVKTLPKIIASNRKVALEGISKEDEQHLKRILNKIKDNCN